MEMRNKRTSMIVAAALAAALSGCSGELGNDSAPVELVCTNTQTISQIDRAGGPGCNGTIGQINLSVIPKNASVTGNFAQVRITRYRVSYQRTDGGTQVPQTFVRSTDQLLSVGSAAPALSSFTVIEADAVNQSPFAALLPQNGGRDPGPGGAGGEVGGVVEGLGGGGGRGRG